MNARNDQAELFIYKTGGCLVRYNAPYAITNHLRRRSSAGWSLVAFVD
ncbi:hypothetical protein ACO0LF_27035 [Undibacterium sp. Di27W]